MIFVLNLKNILKFDPAQFILIVFGLGSELGLDDFNVGPDYSTSIA